jgi:adenosylmethionine-8-amino-7-oxononanoate aminotransferase
MTRVTDRERAQPQAAVATVKRDTALWHGNAGHGRLCGDATLQISPPFVIGPEDIGLMAGAVASALDDVAERS